MTAWTVAGEEGIRNEGQSLRLGLPAQDPFIITRALCASWPRETQRELESYDCGGVSPRDCQRGDDLDKSQVWRSEDSSDTV